MILGQIIFLQVFVALLIIFGLWELLKRELIQAALQDLEHLDSRDEVMSVDVVISTGLSPSDEQRLYRGLKKKFPAAKIALTLNKGIRGGMVIYTEGLLIDQSCLTRVKHLFGKAA